MEVKETKNVPFLKPLIEELGIKEEKSKAVVAAIVMATLRDNKCGVTPENQDEIAAKLIDGVCDKYDFEVAELASYWCNDLLNILLRHEDCISEHDFFRDHIWPYLRNNEVVPGVRMVD